jgi:two-component system response regulator MprA
MGEAILVVDDDAPIRRMLDRVLRAEGYAVPDLIVLDVGMDGLDGLAVCRRIRGKGLSLPVLMLTARDGVPDRVAGLDAGADDYLVKPFATDELLARVRALLRRGKALEEMLAFGDLTLDLVTREATCAGSPVALSGREADLLELLMRNARRVVTRERAIVEIWHGDASDNAVDRYVSNLRRKLAGSSRIDTVRGVGYILR